MPGTVFNTFHSSVSNSINIPLARDPAGAFSGVDFLQSLQEENGKRIYGEKFLEEMDCLTKEKDSEVFFSGVLELGNRLQDAGRLEGAAAVYSALVATVPARIRDRAQTKLNSILGVGAVGPRLGFLIDQFAESATAPEFIVPMIAGSAVFQLARGYQLGKYAAAAEVTWYNRGWGARLSSSAFGMAFEVPTFALGGRFLAQSLGKPVSSSVGEDLANAGLTLLAFRGAGFLGNQAFLRWNGFKELAIPQLQGLARAAGWLLPQATMFGGLYASHRLEQWAGLRKPLDGTTTLTDTLAAMVSLQVGSHLGDRALGVGFRRFQTEAGVRSEIFYQAPGESWKNRLQQSGAEAWEYWKNRPAGFVFMAFPPSGNNGGEAPNIQIMARVQAQIRRAVVEEWKRTKFSVGRTPSGSGQMMMDLHLDNQTGFLIPDAELIIRQEEAPATILRIRIRADLLANKIIVPDAFFRGLNEQLKYVKSVDARGVLEGILSLHEQRIGDLERIKRVEQDKTEPGIPIFVEEMEIKEKKSKSRSDSTLPLFLGATMVAPKPMSFDAEGLRILLANLAEGVLRFTRFIDRPPLIYFVNPPVLIGHLFVDPQGSLMGSSLGRPQFSSDGQKITSQSQGIPITEVGVLLSKDGSLLSYRAQQGLNPVQKKLFNALDILPENLAGQQAIVRDYPYAWGMIYGEGVGRMLLNFNEALATGLRKDGTYVQRLYLIQNGSDSFWVPQSKLQEPGIPKNTLAVVDAGINPLSRAITRKPPKFVFHLKWGELPSDARMMLEYLKERVEKVE